MDTLSAPNTTNSLPLRPSHRVGTPAINTTTISSNDAIPPQKPKHTKAEEAKATTKKKEVYQVSATECANCGTTTTPLWRRGPNGDTICNACGLYFKARNHFRPPTLKRNSHRGPPTHKDDPSVYQQAFAITGATTPTTTTTTNDCGSGPETGTCPGGGQCNGSGGSASCAGCPAFNQHQVSRHALICANCRTTTTPLWRRDEDGNTICNACGLYYKLHNMHRPVSMKRSVIKRRKRMVVAEIGDGSDGHDEEQHETSPAKDDQEEMMAIPSRTQKKQSKRFKAATQSEHRQRMSDQEEVPAIEDYIVPRRRESSTSSSPPAMALVAPRPRLPQPSNGIESLLFAAEVDNFHTPYPLPPPQQHQAPHPHQLPPISLPPLSSSLTDFDDAIERLASFRRRPSSHHVLLQLIPSLQDLVRRAEAGSIHHSQQHPTPL